MSTGFPILFGQAPLWSPASLGSDLSVWLDAEDESTIVLNGSTVSLWKDKSGNGRDASQTTASKQPIYQNGLFGQNTLTFDGIGTQLNFAAPSSTTGPYSIFCVFAPRVATPIGVNFKTALSHAYTGAGSIQLQTNPGGPAQIAMQFTNDSAVTKTYNLTPYTRFMRVITEIVFSATDSAVTANGGTLATQSDVVTLGRNRNMRLGVSRTGTVYLEMDFAEIVIVTTVLADDVRRSLEGYLAWKWDMVALLPANHPYKTFPPMG